jgi:predicted aminopeptidase
MLRLSLFVLLAGASICAAADNTEQVIESVKSLERSVGFQPTGNFTRADNHVAAYYRCYFTGKRELPDSYVHLGLREGTQNGCRLDEQKYDVFFYAIEAVASGHAPVTESLTAATVERIATVVPHEDFHEQIQKVPGAIAEAAATLVGFITGAAALGDTQAEAELFGRKADMINRYYERLAAIYRSEHNQRRALQEKQALFASLQIECAGIEPNPRSFNKCVSAPNNAGLAFDHSYTEYYPLLYELFTACRKDLKCTIARIVNAPKKKPEAEVVRYLLAAASGF